MIPAMVALSRYPEQTGTREVVVEHFDGVRAPPSSEGWGGGGGKSGPGWAIADHLQWRANLKPRQIANPAASRWKAGDKISMW